MWGTHFWSLFKNLCYTLLKYIICVYTYVTISVCHRGPTRRRSNKVVCSLPKSAWKITTLTCQPDNDNTSGLYVLKIMNDHHETMYDQVMTKPRVSGKISNDQCLSLHYAAQALRKRWARLGRRHVQILIWKPRTLRAGVGTGIKLTIRLIRQQALLRQEVRYCLRTSRPTRSISDVSCMSKIKWRVITLNAPHLLHHYF
jgi:hypothetical protein